MYKVQYKVHARLQTYIRCVKYNIYICYMKASEEVTVSSPGLRKSARYQNCSATGGEGIGNCELRRGFSNSKHQQLQAWLATLSI